MFLTMSVFLIGASSSGLTTVPNHYGNALPVIGNNTDGGSVFTNYDNLKKNNQGFFLKKFINQYEAPAAVPVEIVTLHWIANPTFSTDPMMHAYVAKSLAVFLGNSQVDIIAQGAESLTNASRTQLITATYVPQTNVIEMNTVMVADDYVYNYRDDGRAINYGAQSYEPNDDGDTAPSALTSSFVGTGSITWITVDEAAYYLNISVSELTPEKFPAVYEKNWYILNRAYNPAVAPVVTVEMWGQCGGIGGDYSSTIIWGPCVTGSSCVVQSKWYSQCKPPTRKLEEQVSQVHRQEDQSLSIAVIVGISIGTYLVMTLIIVVAMMQRGKMVKQSEEHV